MKSKFKILLTLVVVFVGQFIFAQSKTVSGTVSDQNGVPLPGVSVLEKGTSNGTQTDFDGNYKIKVKEGAILTFSYISMKTKEAVALTETLNVSLEEDVAELEGVVVTALGIKREKSSWLCHSRSERR